MREGWGIVQTRLRDPLLWAKNWKSGSGLEYTRVTAAFPRQWHQLMSDAGFLATQSAGHPVVNERGGGVQP